MNDLLQHSQLRQSKLKPEATSPQTRHFSAGRGIPSFLLSQESLDSHKKNIKTKQNTSNKLTTLNR